MALSVLYKKSFQIKNYYKNLVLVICKEHLPKNARDSQDTFPTTPILIQSHGDNSRTTSSPAHLFAIRGRQKRGPGTLQTRD